MTHVTKKSRVHGFRRGWIQMLQQHLQEPVTLRLFPLSWHSSKTASPELVIRWQLWAYNLTILGAMRVFFSFVVLAKILGLYLISLACMTAYFWTCLCGQPWKGS